MRRSDIIFFGILIIWTISFTIAAFTLGKYPDGVGYTFISILFVTAIIKNFTVWGKKWLEKEV